MRHVGNKSEEEKAHLISKSDTKPLTMWPFSRPCRRCHTQPRREEKCGEISLFFPKQQFKMEGGKEAAKVLKNEKLKKI